MSRRFDDTGTPVVEEEDDYSGASTPVVLVFLVVAVAWPSARSIKRCRRTDRHVANINGARRQALSKTALCNAIDEVLGFSLSL